MEALEKLANAVARRKELHDPRYHLFLTRCLSKYNTKRGYKILAQLIRDGYLSTILTSNSDTTLEEELEALGVYSPQYKVLVVGQHADDLIIEALDPGEENGIHIVKLAEPGLQTAQVALFSDLSGAVQSSLQTYFNRNSIIVGCMDQEDIGTSSLASHKDGGIYYVRQNTPLPDDIVVKCIRDQGKELNDFLIVGLSGEFNEFFSQLDTLIKNRGSQKQNLPTLRSQPPPKIVDEPPPPPAVNVPESRRPPESKRSTVFISYSHKDFRYLNRLLTHLNDRKREGSVDVWSDKRIKAGDDWQKEIEQAIAHARVAVLLISADFMASSFITRVELPALLEVANREEMTILHVFVSPGDYRQKAITRFQAVNTPSRPLSRMTGPQRDEVWTRVAETVREILAPDNLS